MSVSRAIRSTVRSQQRHRSDPWSSPDDRPCRCLRQPRSGLRKTGRDDFCCCKNTEPCAGFIRYTTWLWVKQTGYPTPIGERKHRPKPGVPKVFSFSPVATYNSWCMEWLVGLFDKGSSKLDCICCFFLSLDDLPSNKPCNKSQIA